jgi:hypothetical protein
MKMTCPACGREATKVAAALSTASAAYCKHCGWNAVLAASKLRSDERGLWIVVILGAVLSLWALVRSGSGFALLVACGFVVFPGAFAGLTRYRIRQIGSAPIQHVGVSATPLASFVAHASETSARDSQYAGRPRRVRLSWRGWLYFVGMGVLSVVLTLFFSVILRDESLSFRSGTSFIPLAFFGFYVLLCFSFFRNRWAERGLLSEGRYAHGIVLEQQERQKSMPRICYSFRDFTGRGFAARGTDFSRHLYEGMPVSVFYDESEPARSVALESSLFRIDGDNP